MSTTALAAGPTDRPNNNPGLGDGDGSQTTTAQGSGSTGASTDSQDDTKKVITWEEPDLASNRVFITPQDPVKEFTYTYNSSIALQYLHWMGKTDVASDFEAIANATFGKDGNVPTSELISKLTTKSATLEFQKLAVQHIRFYKLPMQLQIEWTNVDNGISGTSHSGLFSAVQFDSDPAGAADDDIKDLIDADPSHDLVGGYDDIPSSSSTATTSISAGATNSGTASERPPKGGLGTGAIAGIAVGTVLGGLLLIGALVFFLIRRRRQSKDIKGGLSGQQSSGTYMVDKETHGRTTDSPNSPYSDENQTHHVNLEDLDTSRKDPNVHAEQPSFTPYDDAPGRPSMSGSRGLGDTGAQTPTQPVSSNVAHLVEDGMTREEIERLEEEERQLDAEIERAARR